MRPGELVTCACCGAQTIATWTSKERVWQDGYPLVLTWTHGPHPRHEATHHRPDLCIWCHEPRQALGADAAPLYRPVPGAAPAAPEGSTPAPARGQLSLI